MKSSNTYGCGISTGSFCLKNAWKPHLSQKKILIILTQNKPTLKIPGKKKMLSNWSKTKVYLEEIPSKTCFLVIFTTDSQPKLQRKKNGGCGKLINNLRIAQIQVFNKQKGRALLWLKCKLHCLWNQKGRAIMQGINQTLSDCQRNTLCFRLIKKRKSPKEFSCDLHFVKINVIG